MRIRHFSRNVAIRLQNAARPVARRRKTNKPEGEDTTGANRKAPRLPVPGAGSRPQFPLSHAAIGLYIARTVSDPEREIAAAGEGVAIAVSSCGHFMRMTAIWENGDSHRKWMIRRIFCTVPRSILNNCSRRQCFLPSEAYTKRDRRIRSGLSCLFRFPALLAINSTLSSAVYLSKRNKCNGTRNSEVV